MHRKLSGLLLFLLPITNTMALEWTSIIKDTEHEVFVDIDSYNVSENLPFLIAKTIHQKPQQFTLSEKVVPYFISIAKLQFNCQEPLYRRQSMQLMDEKNKNIDTIKMNGQLKKLQPNTDEFLIGQLTCQVHQMLGGTPL